MCLRAKNFWHKGPDFDTFFTKPLILLESKNKLGTTLKVSVDYLIR